MSPPPIAEGGVACAPSNEMLAVGLPSLRLLPAEPGCFGVAGAPLMIFALLPVATASNVDVTRPFPLFALLMLPCGAIFSSSGCGLSSSEAERDALEAPPELKSSSESIACPRMRAVVALQESSSLLLFKRSCERELRNLMMIAITTRK